MNFLEILEITKAICIKMNVLQIHFIILPTSNSFV